MKFDTETFVAVFTALLLAGIVLKIVDPLLAKIKLFSYDDVNYDDVK